MARIALVSPARSRQIEGALLRMAQTGQLPRGRVNEEQLIALLEQVRRHRRRPLFRLMMRISG